MKCKYLIAMGLSLGFLGGLQAADSNEGKKEVSHEEAFAGNQVITEAKNIHAVSEHSSANCKNKRKCRKKQPPAHSEESQDEKSDTQESSIEPRVK